MNQSVLEELLVSGAIKEWLISRLDVGFQLTDETIPFYILRWFKNILHTNNLIKTHNTLADILVKKCLR